MGYLVNRLSAIIVYVNIDLVFIAITLVVIVVSMVIHEIAHAYTSYWLGDDTAKLNNRLSINPLKHLDPILSVFLPLSLAIIGAPIFGGAKPVPYNPANIKWGEWGAALVAIAGPLTNLFLAFIGFLLMITVQPNQTSIAGISISMLLMANLGFFVFNMIPIPPLDGSRILYALAPDYARRALEFMEQYGLFIVLAIVIFFQDVLAKLLISSEQAIIHLFRIITMTN